ncbi:GIY-YIG nuclease family protein [Christiangramia fulva]|uniref:GIY-YIG nuclease family protein n=1 Tax=Christiangramia fulva TaxID=2126553 RepID=UPI001D05BFD2|nr:GIY-YIG nuclease family protein [Christiangramia fulva]
MNLPYAIYILKCSNGQYYTGYTENVDKRLEAHNKGNVNFTKDKLPVELVHLSLFPNKKKACDFERYLKTGFERLLEITDSYKLIGMSSFFHFMRPKERTKIENF